MLKDIAVIIAEYGISALLLALAIYGGIFLIKELYSKYQNAIKSKEDSDKKNLSDKDSKIGNLLATNQELSNLIRQSNEELLKTFKELAIKDNHSNISLSNQETNTKIYKILNNALTEIGCDRISIFMFHNGGTSLNGKNFQKMSCTDQVVRCGVASSQHLFQSIFQSSFLYVINRLMEEDYCLIENLDNLMMIDYALYDIFNSVGIKSLCACPIVNSDNMCIGFIMVSFISNDPLRNYNELTELLATYSTRLEGLM